MNGSVDTSGDWTSWVFGLGLSDGQRLEIIK